MTILCSKTTTRHVTTALHLSPNSWCWRVIVQEYDFEYEDDDDEEPDADLENRYYNAKGILMSRLISIDRLYTHTGFDIARKEDDPEGAITEFQGVVDAEEEKGDW